MNQVEAKLIDYIKKHVGVQLPRLAMVEAQEGDVRNRLMKVAECLIDQGQDEIFRSILYRTFVKPGAQAYLRRLLDWHTMEIDEYGFRSLESAIINNVAANNFLDVAAHLLKESAKIGRDGFCWMLDKIRRHPEILTGIRKAYSAQKFDVEQLAFLAESSPKRYDLLAGAGGKSDRLIARHANYILDSQIPHHERGFRRPGLVPFYGRLLEWQTSALAKLKEDAISLAKKYSIQIEESKLQDLPEEFNCAVLGINANYNPGSTLGLIAIADFDKSEGVIGSRMTHRKKVQVSANKNTLVYRLGVLEVPNPEPWNLFPKALIPPDKQKLFAAAYLNLSKFG